MSPTFTELFQEGLRIPPLKLFRSGQPDETLFDLLAKNVRVPEKVLGDLNAQISAHLVAEKQLQAYVERYGADELAVAFEDLMDYSERFVRSEIAQWPKRISTFTDYLDGDGFDRNFDLVKQKILAVHMRDLFHEDYPFRRLLRRYDGTAIAPGRRSAATTATAPTPTTP